MVNLLKNVKISPHALKVMELVVKYTNQSITVSDIPDTLEEIGVYSAALGDTEIARGTLKWDKGGANNDGWVPILRYKHPEDAPEEGLSRVAMRVHGNRYPLHIGALEELDTMLSSYLAYTYNK